MWLRPALPPADEVENNYEYDTILEADAENLQKVRRAIERDRGRGELAESPPRHRERPLDRCRVGGA